MGGRAARFIPIAPSSRTFKSQAYNRWASNESVGWSLSLLGLYLNLLARISTLASVLLISRWPGLQPGQLVATARTAEQDQELVADELATQLDEDGRSAGQARPLRLAAAGRGVPEPAAVRRDAGEDLGVACAGWLTRRLRV